MNGFNSAQARTAPAREHNLAVLGIVSSSPDTTQADAEILTLVRARATGHQNAVAHRRALQQKIGLFNDFEHFRRLCIRDLRDAFLEDRAAMNHAEPHSPSRMTKNRRGGWLVAFRYYARHAGIEQGVEIVAVDRRGHYECNLVDKAEKTGNWGKTGANGGGLWD